MQRMKIIFLIYILISFSHCINEVKNTFTPSKNICLLKNMMEPEGFINSGEWEKTEESDIPERLVFYWTESSGYKYKCLFTKEDRNKIKCAADDIISHFNGLIQIYMDSNNEYILKALNKPNINIPCQDYHYKNSFIPSGKINVGEENFSILGNWKITQETDIPETLEFDLIFDDNYKTKCSFTKENLNEIKCNGKTYSEFIQQFMDTNREYLLKGLDSISPEPTDPTPDTTDPTPDTTDPTPDTTDPTPDTTDPTPVPASSSFLYFNILTLFAIIFILF